MMFTSLLLLSSLLAAPLAAADMGQPVPPAAQFQMSDAWTAQAAATQEAATQFAWQDEMNLAADSNDICYKIRAYIFKRDDDHAPELKGTTTCGPRQPRAKNVVWPKARLVPAE